MVGKSFQSARIEYQSFCALVNGKSQDFAVFYGKTGKPPAPQSLFRRIAAEIAGISQFSVRHKVNRQRAVLLRFISDVQECSGFQPGKVPHCRGPVIQLPDGPGPAPCSALRVTAYDAEF